MRPTAMLYRYFLNDLRTFKYFYQEPFPYYKELFHVFHWYVNVNMQGDNARLELCNNVTRQSYTGL